MGQATDGNKVKVHYTGKFEDGQVFDSSKDREPLEFTIGEGQVIPGFEKEIRGMSEGDTKSITLQPEDAYGPRRDELMVDVKKSDFPENISPEVGQPLQMRRPDGQTVNVVVTNVQDETVTLDANHPLAGKVLIFDVELVEVAA